jgi:hypothetical protein
LLHDPSLIPYLVPLLVHWSIACTIQSAFDCSPIRRLYHPPYIQLITDPTLFPSSAPSLANWSIACTTDPSLVPLLRLRLLADPSLLPSIVHSLGHRFFAIQRSFDSSLIPRLHYPSLLGLLTDPSLLPGSVLLYIKVNRWGLNLLQLNQSQLFPLRAFSAFKNVTKVLK